MIPATDTDINLLSFAPVEMPSLSYRFDLDTQHVRGVTDSLDAMKQAVYLTVGTERFQYPIYSWNYGVELAGLIGRPISYCLPEIKRRITEALVQDDRITGTDNWAFEVRRGKVLASFTVHTIYGELDANREVTV